MNTQSKKLATILQHGSIQDTTNVLIVDHMDDHIKEGQRRYQFDAFDMDDIGFSSISMVVDDIKIFINEVFEFIN